MKKLKTAAPFAAGLRITALLFAAGIFAASCSRKQKADGVERVWTDSAGRQVEIAARLERIAPSGPLAQIILYSLCPDKVIGWASGFSEGQKRYIPQKYWDKPVFGQFYGRNASMNYEAVIAAKPDILIDLGEAMPNIRADMDGLQAQIGVPVVFVEATLETMSSAYRILGELLGEKEKAEELAAYIDETFADAASRRAGIPPEKRLLVYLGEGRGGLQTNAQGSIHADIIEWAGGINAADFNNESPGGMTSVSLEQVFQWKPDVIVLGGGVSAKEITADAGWLALPAVREGRVYDVPQQPWSWTGRPPSINRLIGIKWLGNLLYPDVFDYDIAEEARRFYRLFYHTEYAE